MLSFVEAFIGFFSRIVGHVSPLKAEARADDRHGTSNHVSDRAGHAGLGKILAAVSFQALR
jgi:hypothetical protein